MPKDPPAARGKPGRVRGEHGIESVSLMFSSAEEVSDIRDSRGGTRLAEKVRTRGDPQISSEPLSTILAVFWKENQMKLSGKRLQK